MVTQIIPCLIESIKLYYRLTTLTQGQLLTCISMARSPPLLRPCLRFRRPASRRTPLAHLRLFSDVHKGSESSYLPPPQWRWQSLKEGKNPTKSLYPRYGGGPLRVDYKRLEQLFGHIQPGASFRDYPVAVNGMPYTIIGLSHSSYSQEGCRSKGQLARI